MSDQYVIQVAIDKKAVSKELLNSVVPTCYRPWSQHFCNYRELKKLATYLTRFVSDISKKDFAAINGISSALLEKWIANGVVLLVSSPSITITITPRHKNRKTDQMQTVVMERQGNALINLEAWREKNRQQAIKCRCINL